MWYYVILHKESSTKLFLIGVEVARWFGGGWWWCVCGGGFYGG